MFFSHSQNKTQIGFLNGILKREISDMPQSIIFYGCKGIGKRIYAREFVKNLICKKFTPIFSSEKIAQIGKRLEDNNYQDLLVINQFSIHKNWDSVKREKISREGASELPVDLVRDVKIFLQQKSFNGGARCIIIENADMFNKESGNAMLKILEEPPQNSFIILITDSLNKFPATIASRCYKICFKPPSLEESVQYITNYLSSSKSPNFPAREEQASHANASNAIDKGIDIEENFTKEEIAEASLMAGNAPETAIKILASRFFKKTSLFQEYFNIMGQQQMGQKQLPTQTKQKLQELQAKIHLSLTGVTWRDYEVLKLILCYLCLENVKTHMLSSKNLHEKPEEEQLKLQEFATEKTTLLIKFYENLNETFIKTKLLNMDVEIALKTLFA